MRRFIESMKIKSLVNTFIPEHLLMLKNLLGSSSGDTADETLFGQTTFLSGSAPLQDCAYVKLLPPFVLHYYDSVSHSYLRRCYQKILPGIDVLEIPQLCRKYKSTLWYSQNLNTSKKQPVCILAKWIGEDGQIIDDSNPLQLCAGTVEYFFN